MLWKCDDCTTLYAPDVPACPQCGATGWTLVDSGGRPVEADAVTSEPATEPPELALPKAKAVKADA